MIYILLAICQLSLSFLTADTHSKIEAYLAINAPQDALQECQKVKDKKSRRLLEVKCFAALGDIPAMLKSYSQLESPDSKLLEVMAWAIIRKASESNSPFIRQEAALAAFMANDAKSIPLALRAIDDSSEQARLIAINMAAKLPDDKIKKRSLEKIQNDSSPRVRSQAILTSGYLHIEEAKDILQAILEESEVDPMEKIAAIEALTNIYRTCDKELIQKLATSPRAQERLLACYLVLMLQESSGINPILSLVNDGSQDVRLLALQCVGIVAKDALSRSAIEPLLSHQDNKTKLLACWLLLLKGDSMKQAEHTLREFLNHPDARMRLYAASAISHAGKCGVDLALYGMKTNPDPIVRLNLAMSLIWQRVEQKDACMAIIETMKTKIRLSEVRFGIFSVIGPTTSRHVAHIARLPETEDLLTRLELYAMISSCSCVDIKESIRIFLKERTWGISGQAACLMMQEGILIFDELRDCLKDPNREIGLQAAFLLALNAQDEEALQVLKLAFPTSSRQMKEFIIYAMGTIGAKSMLPFLVEVLNEPFESLRVSAARAILLSLYH